MKTHFNSLVRIAATLSLVGITFTQAADQYWNPSPLTGNWANSVWSATSGGGSLTTWTASNNAIFDQAGTYNATINANQTATNINIKNGAVTFDGTHTVSSNNLTIDSGASLTADSARFMKSGTTTLTVNGTLNQTGAITAADRTISIAGGTGSIVMAAGFRTNGDFNFSGNISGAGQILTQGLGTITLSGNNSYSGNTFIRSGNILRLGSTTALSNNSFLTFGGTAVTNIVELTGTNFARSLAGSGAGNVQFQGGGSYGFAAVNADRTVAINGTVTWGSGNFNPTVFHLGTAASTHKVTLTTGIDLNAGTRTIDTTNGVAAVEAEISGVLSGTGASALTKTGTGVLLLSNANTYAGGTNINAGTLLVNNTTGSGTGAGAVAVNGGTLGGTGSISGATTIGALGKLSPTAQASGSKLSLGSTLAFDSGGTSIFNWDLSAANTPDPGAVSNNGDYGQVAVTGVASGTAVFNIALLGGAGKTSSYADAFWDTNKTWNNLFASSGMTNLSTLFTSFTGTGLTPSGSGATARATAGDQGYFSFNGSTTLTWTAVPEPTSALAGLLLGAGLLRRRR